MSPNPRVSETRSGSGPIKCRRCEASHERAVLDGALWVCPACQYHFRITPTRWIDLLCDADTFAPRFEEVLAADPLHFADAKSYPQRVKEAREATGDSDAVTCGRCMIESIPAHLAVFNFMFLGGSMGSVVGERIARCFEAAAEERTGIVTIASSGGARMQEGLLSLMQMAKTSGAVARFREHHLPFISILSDPTTGGVSASFTLLGDVILAEPQAQIGFTGPRVIKDAFGHEIAQGAQRAEFHYEHGLIDRIVQRRDMRKTVGQLLRLFLNRPRTAAEPV